MVMALTQIIKNLMHPGGHTLVFVSVQLRCDLVLKDIFITVVRSLSNCFAAWWKVGQSLLNQLVTADPGWESEGTWSLHEGLMGSSAETLFAVWNGWVAVLN